MIAWAMWNVLPGFLLSALLSVLVMTQQDPPQPPPRAWGDVFLGALLIVLLMMLGTMVERKSGFGWALAIVFIAMALLFGWGLFAPLIPGLVTWTIIGTMLRAVLVIGALLSIAELAASRRRWPSPLESLWRRLHRRRE